MANRLLVLHGAVGTMRTICMPEPSELVGLEGIVSKAVLMRSGKDLGEMLCCEADNGFLDGLMETLVKNRYCRSWLRHRRTYQILSDNYNAH